MSDNLPIDKFSSTIMQDILSVVRGMGVESSNRMIDKAPSASGKLKSSIKAAINAENISFGDEDPSGSTTKAQNESIIAKAQAGDEINIVVGAPYGAIIERGDGNRPPVGFVLTTGEEYEAILAIAVQQKERFK